MIYTQPKFEVGKAVKNKQGEELTIIEAITTLSGKFYGEYQCSVGCSRLVVAKEEDLQ